MANQNDFVSFATGSSANTLTAASYNALSTLIANGFQTGVAQSAEVNTVLRQTSSIAAMIAQFAATGGPMVDDGDTATMLASFQAALKSYSGFLTVNTPAANATIAPSSLVTIVQPAQASGTITLTINAGSINGQRLIVYGNANGATIVNSVATSGNPAFTTPIGTSVYTTTVPAIFGTFVEMMWDGSNWRILPIYAFAPLASPAFTGTPTAPTAAAGAANTQIANTQWINTYYTTLLDVENIAPVSADNTVNNGLSVSATTGTLTAPSNGVAFVQCTVGSTTGLVTFGLSASLGALKGTAKATPGTTDSAFAYLPMTKGQSSTFSGSAGAPASGTVSVLIYAFFIPTPGVTL